MAHVARLALFMSLTLALVMLLGAPPAVALDQACDHPISAPGTTVGTITISTPGLYCLTTDVVMAASFKSGNAIEIAANYVTLDLNGHKVHGAAAGSATAAVGIHAQNRRNVTIKNGTVWGFDVGIQLGTSSSTTLAGYLIEGVRAELNRETGILVSGANNTVRNNIVANTGPSGMAGPHVAYGILVAGDGTRVVNNDVLTVTATGAADEAGIFIAQCNNVLVVGNRITTADFGIKFDPFATGKFRDNLAFGIVMLPYDPGGATNAGNNN